MLIFGAHGTNSKSALEILKNNYFSSIGDIEWLGDGVYFFTEGIVSNTTELAMKWAVAQSWDKNSKRYLYSEYSVLSSKIEVEETTFLDLTSSEGIEVFEYLKQRFFKKLQKRMAFLDGQLLNLARVKEFFHWK